MADNICCCDLTPHPDDLRAYSDVKAVGGTGAYRYQLVSGSSHVMYIELFLETSAETNTVTVKFFTTDEPDDGTPDGDSDTNIWYMSLGPSEGAATWTPPQFEGKYFENGIFAEVMSTDTTAQVAMNILYYRRDTYLPAIPETPNQRRERIWKCYNRITEDDDSQYLPYGDNFDKGYEGDDYSDTTSSSSPGSGTGGSEID